MEMPYSLRQLDPGDIKKVQEIERAIFPTLLPKTPFKKELKNKMARYLVAYVNKNVEDQSRIPIPNESNKNSPNIFNKIWEGFRIICQQTTLYRYKIQILNPNIVGLVGTWHMTDEAHITTIGVLSEYRKKGIGELLLIGCIEQALANKCSVVTLEVRISNIEAQKLYTKYGFENVGLRKRYYSDNKEDAVIMTTNPINQRAYQSKFHKLIEKHNKNWGKSIRIA